jgi:hypothetical protein
VGSGAIGTVLSTETTDIPLADMVYYVEGSMRKRDMASVTHGGGVGDLFMLYNAITATGRRACNVRIRCVVRDANNERR